MLKRYRKIEPSVETNETSKLGLNDATACLRSKVTQFKRALNKFETGFKI